jgi:hypothetical protein
VQTQGLGMPTLKTAPRGYARDHPRAELLRRKGLIGYRTLTGTKLRSGEGVGKFVVETFEACGPMVAWLGSHVGAPAGRGEPER